MPKAGPQTVRHLKVSFEEPITKESIYYLYVRTECRLAYLNFDLGQLVSMLKIIPGGVSDPCLCYPNAMNINFDLINTFNKISSRSKNEIS